VSNADSAVVIAQGVDEEPVVANQRVLAGWQGPLWTALCIAVALFHLGVLNVFPLETWSYRILHVAFGLLIGFGLMAHRPFRDERSSSQGGIGLWLDLVGLALVGLAAAAVAATYLAWMVGGLPNPPSWLSNGLGAALLAGTVAAVVGGWLSEPTRRRISMGDWALGLASLVVAAYLLFNLAALQFRAGVMPTQPDYMVSVAGVILILELTRRVAGLALVTIAGIFVAYAFLGPFLPGFLTHTGYQPDRFFTYLYTDNGILGPTTAVSSTYIVLFIAFAAFLQASKVGDYFVNFAFAAAGRARGGPAKVAVFASGLMGMINGTSAGNVVATGSLTIPLMKRVGYRPQSAAAIEAAASTGGQIMPPVMGAGAFIMAEVTGIPYTEIAIAALIPAALYFLAIYFVVDLEAAKQGMRGMRNDELPQMAKLMRQAFLFLPIVMLIVALFAGYSVIRAGTYALIAAVIVSWLSPNKLGPRGILKALELSTTMAIQLIAVCACAGIIVGVIGLTGVGLRFSSLLLTIAENSQLLALVFAMGIAILLGMGMPTTAAYAVAASVVAPGLIKLGIDPLVAHFFVFYYAVVSAITPPVALAAYAGAGISGSDPMRTSVTAFVYGLAAFIVPFMFFYSPGLLMNDTWPMILRNVVTASFGIYLLSAAVQGYLVRPMALPVRALTLVAALSMIEGGLLTDAIGIVAALVTWSWQRRAPGKTVPA